MGDLTGGVDAGVGPPRYGEVKGALQHQFQSAGYFSADGALMWLDGPSGEVSAVIGDVETQPHDVIHTPPVGRGADGWYATW